MGGINHQPCGKFLAKSTRLSRALSLAHAQFELANVRLEDVLLSELDGSIGSITPIVDHMEASLKALSEAIQGIHALRDQMERENYTDLPTLRSVSLSSIGADLAAKCCVNQLAWNAIANTMKAKGFFGVLGYFEGQIQSLIKKNKTLLSGIQNLHQAAEKGEVNRILEENREGNIKLAFAEVYAAWAEFHQEFLASSLISTEVWYKFNHYGSLSNPEAVCKVA